jgi:hypothetical protein
MRNKGIGSSQNKKRSAIAWEAEVSKFLSEQTNEERKERERERSSGFTVDRGERQL